MISISSGEGGGGHVLWCVVGLSGFCSAMNYEKIFGRDLVIL